ncbi:MAG: DUF1801 domain-containing protein [Gemmatimonadaceae bacterium]
MASSQARTVTEYLAELPAERRKVMGAVRKVVKDNLPKGYVEEMAFGMIGYGIPLSRYPDTYNKQPLSYVGLAAQKNYYALYMNCLYTSAKRTKWFAGEFKKAGKKLDMGESCVRFKRLEDLPMEVIAEAVASVSPEEYIAYYESVKGA